MTDAFASPHAQPFDHEAQRSGLAQFIAERTLRLLTKSGAIAEDPARRCSISPSSMPGSARIAWCWFSIRCC